MSTGTGLKGGQMAAGFAAGLAAIAAVGFGVSFLSAPSDAPDADAGQDAAAVVASDAEPSPETAQTETAQTGTAQTGTSASKPATSQTDVAEPDAVPGSQADVIAELPDAPEVSTFRLESDGQMLVAGRSAPGWETTIHLDTDALVTFVPDATGEFVQFVKVDPSQSPRILTLTMRSPDTGENVASEADIIIAPLHAPTEPSVADQAPGSAPDGTTIAALDPDTSDHGTPEAPNEPAPPSDDTTRGLDDDTTAPPADTAGAATGGTEPVDEAGEETAGATQGAAQGLAEGAAQSAAQGLARAPSSGEADDVPTAALISDQEGVRVVQPARPLDAAPDVMSNVALDAIAYSAEGDVELSGRATGEGAVRVYLDDAPVVTSQIAEDGRWRSELPRLDSGVYTLRIDEVAPDGTVTSRVETPFKREDKAVLSAATQSGRAIQAVVVQPGYTLWGISRDRYGDGFAFVRIFEANRDQIRDPDLIYPGQVFALPQ
ncbi:MAG: hypothetical protein AAF484_11520 [Pseudomonadota bacterium]